MTMTQFKLFLEMLEAIRLAMTGDFPKSDTKSKEVRQKASGL